MPVPCNSIEEVRAQIDQLDRQIVALLAERGKCVRLAAQFKKTEQDVKAPARVEQVISKVRMLADELGANPDLTEQIYRTMITAFIETEMRERARLRGQEDDFQSRR